MINRIKLSIFFLILSCILIFIILGYLLFNTLQLQSNKFKYSTDYLSASEFYKYKVNDEKLEQVCDILLKDKNSMDLNGELKEDSKKKLIDTLKNTFNVYKKINENLKESFLSYKINVPFNTLISLNKFNINGSNKIITIADDDKLKESVIYLFGDSSIITDILPANYLYFNGNNYNFQINLYIKYGSLRNYYLRSIKNVIWGAFIILIVFIIIVIYTIKTIKRQEVHDKMKTDFINNITHEIQTPITTISIASRTLSNPIILNQKTELLNLVKSIDNQSRRLINLVDNVLNLSALRNGIIQLNYKKINLHDLINKVVDEFKIRNHQKSFTINTSLFISTPEILADPFYFEMILTNLLDNAFKYSKDIIELNITTLESKKYFEIILSDNGIGISKEYQKHLFKQFYRVPTGNIHKIKGTGLGLYYVYLITKSHKWKISVNSEINIGTTFTLKLKRNIKLQNN
ncbi:MAG: hypothetical protein A2041_00550 [Bacteroidetes bacterium GWA2_31_9b]|nr:MAG: hypothetical protein A2041_00550 [Bacteroidetes bacterium GWA2_31_9b]